MGRMTSVLKPVADRYNLMKPDDRYQFRRLCRSLIKWYGYISQVVRMFDTDLHKEYVFLRYLLGLIPPRRHQMIDLEGKLQLEYYKLQKTFEGAIELKEETGVYRTRQRQGRGEAGGRSSRWTRSSRRSTSSTREQFTDADKVLLTALRAKLMGMTKLQTMAQNQRPADLHGEHLPEGIRYRCAGQLYGIAGYLYIAV